MYSSFTIQQTQSQRKLERESLVVTTPGPKKPWL